MERKGRTRAIAAKVSPDEYARILEAATAANMSVSEFVRAQLIGAGAPNESRYTEVSRKVLAAALAGRLLLMTGLHDLMHGHAWTLQQFADLAAEADAQARKIAAATIKE